MTLWTTQVFPQRLGWEHLDFDSTGDAYKFVEQQLNDGKAASRARNYRAVHTTSRETG
jgi:hypothetical protein